MMNEGLQRTLLVGLGQIGATAVDLLLAELRDWYGQTNLIQGMAVLTEDTPLDYINNPLRVSPETPFDAWHVTFKEQVKVALHRISQLNNLAQLSQQGLILRHPDEIQVIVVANVAESWLSHSLTDLLQVIRDTVDQTLACYVGMSAMLFFVNPNEMTTGEVVVTGVRQTPVAVSLHSLPPDQFDRGCFVAGLTNEVGLIIGTVDDLIERSVDFITLWLSEMPLSQLTWAGSGPTDWNMPLTSFGLATIRWPGRALAEVSSQRWSATLLNQLLNLPQVRGSTVDLARQARGAAQQWLTQNQIVPPLLIDQLSTQMPQPPHRLAELVPDPPWPWLMIEIQSRLEQAGQHWQDEWLTVSKAQLKTTLIELETGWLDQAQTWLEQQANRHKAGTIPAVQSYLAAVSELLNAFVEGVEQHLEEAQADVIKVEKQLGQMAQVLAGVADSLPDSPLMLLLAWGLRPLRWPAYWHRCHQAQTVARNYAHLSRGRLAALQTVWYYEEILPLYRNLLAMWQQYVVKLWDGACQQVRQAAQTKTLATWPTQQQNILTASAGPWRETLISQLYQEAIELHADTIWEVSGTFGQWVSENLDAAALLQRLLESTNQLLQSTLNLPVDQVLCRQLPDEKIRADWLAGLAEQARPFWRYDETTLSETSRANARLETWFVLPDGEDSVLAPLAKNWPKPPLVLTSRRPEKMAVVTIRQIQQEDEEVEELNPNESLDIGV